MKIQRDKFYLIPMLILLKVLYVMTSVLMVSDTYLLWSGYRNLNLSNSIIEIIPFLVGLLILLWKFRNDSPIGLFSLLVFIMAFIPANSGLSLGNWSMKFYIMINAYFLILLLLIGFMMRKEKVSEGNSTAIKDLVLQRPSMVIAFRIIMIITCALTIYYIYRYNGLDFRLIFSKMYETRADYASYALENAGTFISYFSLVLLGALSWMLPIYLYSALINSSIFDSGLALFTFMCLYLMEMQKSTLFIALVVFVIAFYRRKKIRMSFCKLFTYLFVALFAVTLVEYLVRGTSTIHGLIIGRLMYTPSYLSNVYYDYFSGTDKMWLTRDVFVVSNILSRFFEKRGFSSVIATIRLMRFDGKLASPNTGFFAEAYAQMGALGTIVFPFIVAGFLRFVKKNGSYFGYGVELVVMVRFFLFALNTQLLTSVKMVGFIMFLVMTYAIKVMNSTIRKRR